VLYIVNSLEPVKEITTNTYSLNYQNIFGLFERNYSLFAICPTVTNFRDPETRVAEDPNTLKIVIIYEGVGKLW
jgi:hypothetical protein